MVHEAMFVSSKGRGSGPRDDHPVGYQCILPYANNNGGSQCQVHCVKLGAAGDTSRIKTKHDLACEEVVAQVQSLEFGKPIEWRNRPCFNIAPD